MIGHGVADRAAVVVLVEQVRAAVEPLRSAHGARWPLFLDEVVRAEIREVAAAGVRLASDAGCTEVLDLEELRSVFASVLADVEACA